MNSMNLADAKAQLSALVDRVEAGDTIDITRHGKPVARISAVTYPRKPVNLGMLQALTNTLPVQTEIAADLVRAMRDGVATNALCRYVAHRRGEPRRVCRRLVGLSYAAISTVSSMA